MKPKQLFTFEAASPCVLCKRDTHEIYATTLDNALAGKGVCPDCKALVESKSVPGAEYSFGGYAPPKRKKGMSA